VHNKELGIFLYVHFAPNPFSIWLKNVNIKLYRAIYICSETDIFMRWTLFMRLTFFYVMAFLYDGYFEKLAKINLWALCEAA
jgi:hypothetical protein